MTYSNEDFERFYIRYKAEAVGRGETMQSYCSRNKVPFNLFLKWYKDTRHRVVEVKVDGMPSTSESEPVQSEEICKMNGLDFGTYIEYVMERMVAGEKDARTLLPNRISIPTEWVPESQIDCPSPQKYA